MEERNFTARSEVDSRYPVHPPIVRLFRLVRRCGIGGKAVALETSTDKYFTS